ncbi:MAG: TonB-dependent receptor [Gemmatimonadota bacterium]
MSGRLVCACLGLWTVAVPSAAQIPDSIKPLPLEPLEVTVVREGTVAPPVVTIAVGADAIRRAQADTPYDLVRRLAGIEVHEHGQGPGFAADAVLRGFTSDHSSDVLLVVDGVPINLPVHGHVEGYSDWFMLVAPALRELRVIHGPASPLYGDFAFGGVVEAFTEVDEDVASGSLGTSSQGGATAWFRGGRRGERGGLLFTADGERNEGWREHSGFWLGRGLARGWRALGDGRLEGGASVYLSDWNSPSFVSVDQYNAGELRQAVDPTDGGRAHRLIVHGRYTGVIGSGGVQATAWAQTLGSLVFLNLPDDGVLAQSEERDERVAAGGRVQALWNLRGGDATLGTEVRRDASQYRLFATDQRERESATTGLDGDYTSVAAYARWRTRVNDRVTLDLGGRLDGLYYTSVDRLNDPESASPRTNHVWLASPKIGVRYALDDRWSALGSFSRGFRGAPGVLTDPQRPAMTAWAGELGLQLLASSVTARLAAFRLDVTNERIQDPVSRVISNQGASVRQGLSVDVAWAASARMSLFGSLTYNDAYIAEEITFPEPPLAGGFDGLNGGVAPTTAALRLFHLVPLRPGDPVPNVGRYVGRAGVEAPVGEASALRVTWRFSGPFSPIGEPRVRTQAYGVLDLGASLPARPAHGVLDIELENLTGTRYPEVRASGFINPGAPRTLRVALRFGAAAPVPSH